MFCSVFRVLNKMVLETERDHVLTDSFMSEPEYIMKTLQAYDQLNPLSKNAVTDGVMFDMNQNGFTQAEEREYWGRYGVCTTFLDHYYSFRSRYTVVSSVAVGTADTEKTSGEPGTLVNNGVVSKMNSNYQVEVDGPCVINYKGDDFNKRGLNPRVNKEHKDAIDAACAIKLRVDISDSAEFCGLLFSHGVLFPSIPRKINKIVAHRFRDYAHFCEYQASLRDWMRNVKEYNELRVVAHNAEHYWCSVEEMQAALDCIESISHIGEEQFEEKFKLRSETALIPINRSDGKYVFVE